MTEGGLMCRGPIQGSFFPVLLRIDEGAKLDDVRDRIEVERVGFAAQPQRFERDRAAAGEHIKHARARSAAGANVFNGDLFAALRA